MRIKKILARQILDSRGNPTVEADVILDSGAMGRASVPSGASTGRHEAHELRDKQEAYSGKGVTKAVNNIKKVIAPKLVGKVADDQFTIDDALQHLDDSANKSEIGANAMLAVSLAVAKAAAIEKEIPLYLHIGELVHNDSFCLPMPMFNIINGGKHAKGSTDIQEFMIMPRGIDNFARCLQAGAEIFHQLGDILAKKSLPTTVGDEGGYAPPLAKNTEAIQLISEAVQTAGYHFGKDIFVALDVAASELQQSDGTYKLAKESTGTFKSPNLIDLYVDICKRFPVVSIEDGLGEEDWDSWSALTEEIGQYAMVVADDLTTTNPKLLQKAIHKKAANAILIKPNQIGTLSETIETVHMAQKAGWNTIISHRSGETEDTSISHLAVGLGIHYIKSGSLSRSERIAKYNELLRIGETIPSGHTVCKL